MSEHALAEDVGDGPDCCETSGNAVDPDAIATDLELLSSMGNATRYGLLRQIATADGGVCVCDLQAAVDVSQSAVSQALSHLYAAGLVVRRKEGSWRYYDLTETAAALLDALDDLRGDHV